MRHMQKPLPCRNWQCSLWRVGWAHALRVAQSGRWWVKAWCEDVLTVSDPWWVMVERGVGCAHCEWWVWRCGEWGCFLSSRMWRSWVCKLYIGNGLSFNPHSVTMLYAPNSCCIWMAFFIAGAASIYAGSLSLGPSECSIYGNASEALNTKETYAFYL